MKMGALRAFALVLYVAVVSGAQSPLQTLEEPQNALPIPVTTSPDLVSDIQKNETIHDALLNMKQEFNVTGSVKKELQDISDESITTLPSKEQPEVTTENQILTTTVTTVPEALPTQQTVKLASDEEPGNVDNPKDKPAAKKTFSVPRKGAEYNASFPEKGAYPGQLTTQLSEVDMNVPTPVSIVSDSTVSQKDMGSEIMGKTKLKSSSSPLGNTLPPGPIKKPIPSIISQSKASEDKFIPTTVLPTIPIVKQNESSNSTNPEVKVSQELPTAVHSKPTAAVDKEDNGGGGTYTPAAIGIVLLLCILITVMVLGFQKLQDVWMRRHYARMDFLIDGMYDM